MRKLIHSILALYLFSLTTACFSQLVGSNAYLKGTYVQIGVNQCGAYGSGSAPPTGYSWNASSFYGAGLGFTADASGDGWASGSYPFYCGDYFVPGSPVEGWSVELSGVTWCNTDQYCSPFGIPGSITSYSYSGGVYTAVWEGDIIAGSVNIHITQTTTLPDAKKYFVTKVSFCNNGVSTVNGLYYKRNVDPDNEEAWTGNFSTYNTIVSNPPSGTQALVTSTGLSYGCYLGMGAKNALSRAAYGNFWTTDGAPSAVYNGTGGYSLTGTSTGDIANSLAFKVNSISPGGCQCISFAYILNATDLDEALDATTSLTYTAGGLTYGSGDTITVTSGTTTSLTAVASGAGYTYAWTPGTYLSATSGATVNATFPSTGTFTVYTTGTGTQCGTVTGSIVFLVQNPVLPIELSEFTSSCDAAGTILKWKTLTEQNSNYFEVERRTDGTTFHPIANIPAQGNSSSETDYAFTDKDPLIGNVYYRLCETDLDGAKTYSDIVTTDCNVGLNGFAINSVNIGSSEMNIVFSHQLDGIYTVQLFDIKGQEIVHQQIMEMAGQSAETIPVYQNLPKEAYIVLLTDVATGTVISTKAIKVE